MSRKGMVQHFAGQLQDYTEKLIALAGEQALVSKVDKETADEILPEAEVYEIFIDEKHTMYVAIIHGEDLDL